ncbi:MAG: response regulator [Chloroflexota bacterium]
MSSLSDMPAILVIEDDLDVAEMLDSYFRIQGYHVKTVNWGEDGLKSAKADCPDLVILDIRLPDIDGFEVAKRLRANRSTAAVPIIFLTEKRQRQDRLRGLEVGGDDYITKPFDIQELRLRVRNALLREGQPPTHNPITELPEGKLVEEYLASALSQPNWAILTVKLANLDHFREHYGFITADDALRATSLQVRNALQELGNPDDFLGHLTPDIFVTITSADKIEKLGKELITHGAQALEYFYPTEDLETQASPESRLQLKPALFLGEDSKFKDLSALKTALLNQKPG